MNAGKKPFEESQEYFRNGHFADEGQSVLSQISPLGPRESDVKELCGDLPELFNFEKGKESNGSWNELRDSENKAKQQENVGLLRSCFVDFLNKNRTFDLEFLNTVFHFEGDELAFYSNNQLNLLLHKCLVLFINGEELKGQVKTIAKAQKSKEVRSLLDAKVLRDLIWNKMDLEAKIKVQTSLREVREFPFIYNDFGMEAFNHFEDDVSENSKDLQLHFNFENRLRLNYSLRLLFRAKYSILALTSTNGDLNALNEILNTNFTGKSQSLVHWGNVDAYHNESRNHIVFYTFGLNKNVIDIFAKNCKAIVVIGDFPAEKAEELFGNVEAKVFWGSIENPDDRSGETQLAKYQIDTEAQIMKMRRDILKEMQRAGGRKFNWESLVSSFEFVDRVDDRGRIHLIEKKSSEFVQSVKMLSIKPNLSSVFQLSALYLKMSQLDSSSENFQKLKKRNLKKITRSKPETLLLTLFRLCMSSESATFVQILNHYFENDTIEFELENMGRVKVDIHRLLNELMAHVFNLKTKLGQKKTRSSKKGADQVWVKPKEINRFSQSLGKLLKKGFRIQMYEHWNKINLMALLGAVNEFQENVHVVGSFGLDGTAKSVNIGMMFAGVHEPKEHRGLQMQVVRASKGGVRL